MLNTNSYIFIRIVELSQSVLGKVLQVRLTFLVLPLLLIDWKIAILWIFIAILGDCLILASTFLSTLYSVNKSIKKDYALFSCEGLEIINNPTIDDIKHFYNATAYNYKNRLADRNVVVVKCPLLNHECLSYPYITGSTIILIPDGLDFSFYRDKFLLAHEYMHGIAHDLYITLNSNKRLYGILLVCLSIVFSIAFNSIWTLFLTSIYLLGVILVTKFSAIGTREQEANLMGLRYIEDTEGTEIMQKTAEIILKIRQSQFINNADIRLDLYFSERNQIAFLNYLIPIERSIAIGQKLVASLNEGMSKKNKIKYLQLINIYKSLAKSNSTYGIRMYAFTKIGTIATFLSLALMSYMSYKLWGIFQFIFTWQVGLVAISILVIIYILIKLMNFKLWNQKLKLLEKIGVI